ncbi:MAG: DUF3806 domain-containing protein [Dermatophilaceae bacterium]|nr:DUF3806 domain-containing protein [Intrasporangiaceae bacterium]
MGLFRRDKGDRDAADSAPVVDDGSGVEPLEAISAAPLGPDERARIEAGLAALTTAGIDVDDLGSLSAGFDAAVDRGDASMLPVLAVGVGEHLHRHALLRWAVVTDAFGRDLGLEGRRRDLHIVPDSLLSARWMRREKGWLEGALRHLVDTAAR